MQDHLDSSQSVVPGNRLEPADLPVLGGSQAKTGKTESQRDPLAHPNTMCKTPFFVQKKVTSMEKGIHWGKKAWKVQEKKRGLGRRPEL